MLQFEIKTEQIVYLESDSLVILWDSPCLHEEAIQKSELNYSNLENRVKLLLYIALFFVVVPSISNYLVTFV